MSFKKGDIEKATKQLTDLNRVVLLSLPDAAEAGAMVLKEEAQRRAPVRTGKLKAGFEDRPGNASEKTAANSAVHVVYNRVFYAAPVEYGRYKRPFMRPAAQAAQGAMASAMGNRIKRETKRIL